MKKLLYLLSAGSMVLTPVGRVAFCQPFYYDELPVVSLVPQMGSYPQFAPVLIDMTITNASSKSQDYGLPGRLNASVNWQIQAPDGQTLREHWILDESNWGSRSPALTYQAGESKTDTINLSLSWPVWESTGTYEVAVTF